MSKKIGVILSGSGVYDGSELHEAVFTLLSLDRQGLDALCFAPDGEQMHVIDHTCGEPMNEKRNILKESARIARGEIQALSEADMRDLDAIIFPGGFGAAKNLCNFAVKGPDCDVNPEVEALVNDMIDAGKPIAALCIAPALLARITGKKGIKAKVTIGKDPSTADAIEKMGAVHVNCAVNEVALDEEHKIVTGPAYMMASSISEVAESVDMVVAELKKML